MTLNEEDLLEKDFVELDGNTLKIKENLDVNESINVDRNIHAWDIHAWDIDAWDIDAGDIDAGNIDARNISYFAFCISRESLKCLSIEGRRDNSIHKCLDQDIEYKEGEASQ